MSLIPRLAPYVLVDTKNIISLIKSNKVLFARWVTNFDCKEKRPFWYVIKDNDTNINSYSSNTRNQIRKGLKNCHIRIINKSEIKKNGYNIYKAAFKNYKGAQKFKSKKEFLLELKDKFHCWGIYDKKNNFIGYAQNRILNDFCDYSKIKVFPKNLKEYPYYALLYEMNKYYLDEMKLKYVSNGTKSISHQTNIQELLIKKFNFRKAYCNLHIMYHPIIKPIIYFLFPMRKFFQYIPFNIFYNIYTVLYQEEIRRESIKLNRC